MRVMNLRRSNRWWLLFVFISIAINASLVFARSDSDLWESDEHGSENENDGIIEVNSDYEWTEEYDERSDCERSGSEEEEDDEEDDEGGKNILDKVLLTSRKGTNRSVGFVKKHRKAITFGLFLFAFRREVWGLVSSLLTKKTPSGEKRFRRIPLSPTSILKIVLFIDIMRKLQPSSQDGQPSSMSAGAVLGGPGGMLHSLFHEILQPTNPAYLPPVEQHYTFERINDRYTKDRLAFRKALEPPSTVISGILGQRRKRSVRSISSDQAINGMGTASPASEKQTRKNATAVVLDFTSLDSSVSQIDVIRDEISFLLDSHRANVEDAKSKTDVTSVNETVPELEVIVLLESPGGSASDYGLAASQLARLRDEDGIILTVCVDKVAASGGYMMACVAHNLFCAPFAVVGSIGVIGQALNVHDTLQNWGVRPLVFRGGKDKAPVGVIGEVTKEGIAKVQLMVDKTHDAFKRHVMKARPALARHIEQVTTGDVWLGSDALDAGLVDRVVTSDEYIGEKILDGRVVLRLLRHTRRGLLLFGPPSGRRSPLVESSADINRVLSKLAGFMDDLPKRNGYVS